MGSADASSAAIKLFSLVALTVLTTVTPLVTRYVRIRVDQDLFIVSVMMVTTESIKTLMCSLIIIFSEKSFTKFLSVVKSNIWDQPSVTIKALVPGALYALQSYLYMVALSNLDPVVFCITYQLKILTTAFFVVTMLGKELRRLQYVSLVMLVLGVALVEMESHGNTHGSGATNEDGARNQSTIVGMASVLTMCFSSGFAGVYMEKMFKESASTIWVENIRLQVFQLPIVTMTMLIKDWDAVQEQGMFVGFDWIVIALCVVGSMGGLLVAMTMKYAGNIPKTYAQCLAIIFTAIGAVIWFDLEMSPLFCFGCVVVAVAIGLYNYKPSSDADQSTLPTTIRHVDLRAYTYQNLLLVKDEDLARKSASG